MKQRAEYGDHRIGDIAHATDDVDHVPRNAIAG